VGIDIGRDKHLIAEQPERPKVPDDIRAYAPVTELHFQGHGGGFDCYYIPAPLGLRPDSYDPVREFLGELVSYFTARLGYHHESFIQIGTTSDRAAARLFSENAREWIPETGLGVWPHRPAPRIWTMQDMEDLDPNSGMPTLLHSLFRVTADANVRLTAMTTIVGTGCGVQLVSRAESAVLLRDLKELFLAFIQDRVFRIFPWYVPLIERAVLIEPLEPLVVDAMRGISLYIRESPEDGGILIISPQPLSDIFAQLGCKQVEHGTIPKWKLGDQR
jgi:hypothetical protein